MKRKEQGVLTVEASIVLTTFTLLVLFLFSFARLYRAQNVVSHAVLQSTDALALESYLRETAHNESAEGIVKLGNELSGITSFRADNFTSLRAADVPKLAKEKFIVGVAATETNADAKLKQLGVKDGLSGIDFSRSQIDLTNNDVIVHISYTLKLQFPVFGFDEIELTKAGKAKTFGSILFEINTISNDDRKGTASGGGSYNHGETVVITAVPKYGYYFDGWDDNGDGIVDYDVGDPTTASTRTIVVTEAKTYTAIFKNSGFGVNASVNPAGLETITTVPAAGNNGGFPYGSRVDLTVSNSNPHYTFSGWSGQLLQDKNGDGYEETISSIPNPRNNLTYTIPSVEGNYHLTANFVAKKYNVRVSVKNGVGGTAYFSGTTKTSDRITYPGTVSFTAFPSAGYAVDYWMKGDTIIQSSYGQTTISGGQVTGDANYTVVFKSIKVTVTFLGPNNSAVATYTLNKGQTFSRARLNVPSYTVLGGKIFDGWKSFNSNTVVNSNMSVEGKWVSPSISINSGAKTNVNATTLTVTKFPRNATVTWTSSDTSLATVNSQGVVTAKKNGKVRITATLNYHGLECSDSVTIELGESRHRVVYCMNMASNGRRYYTMEHIELNGSKKWGVRFPGTNHHCYSTGCCNGHADKEVGYSVLANSKEVSKDKNTLHKIGGYDGYNKSGQKGYIFNNGSGNAIYFEKGQVSSGPRGYFIKKINY